MPTYRLHDTTGDDLGLVEHPAPNVEPGDVVTLADGREALVNESGRDTRRPTRRALGGRHRADTLTSDDGVA